MTHMTNSARHTPAAGTLRYLVIGGLLTLAVAARASEWLTYGGDAQRTGWAKDEKILSKDSLRISACNGSCTWITNRKNLAP